MLSNFIQGQNGNGSAQHAPAPEQAAPAPEAEKIPSLSDLISGQSGGSVADDADEIGGFDSVLDGIESLFNEHVQGRTDAPVLAPKPENVTTTAPVSAPAVKPVQVSGATDPFAGEGVKIGVEIYVEILEACVSALASWWSNDEGQDFSFDKKLKARYERITALYAQSQNIEVSPGVLFGAFTLLLIGTVGFKAHKRRVEVMKLQSARQRIIDRQNPVKKSNGQFSLFDNADMAEDNKNVVINKDNSVSIPETERMRVDWQIDPKTGFYLKSATGQYIAKENRVQKPSPELRAFMEDYRGRYLDYPKNKFIKEYIKTL